jgi:hypothetical protein
MNLKTAVFEIKEAINKQEIAQTEDEFIHGLEMKNQLKAGTLVFYFNNLMMFSIKSAEYMNQPLEQTKKVNRKWTKNEVDFMFQYITERQNEGALNITEILDEIAQLINRGYQSVNYKYYTLVKAQEKKEAVSKSAYQYTTIEYNDVPVVSTEAIPSTNIAPVENKVRQTTDDDLLDILSGLITNVQQLPGINLNELLRSLYQLTNMAIQNQEVVQQVESMKSEINIEKQNLQEKLDQKELQLQQERKRNEELQAEVSKLAKEIMAFNQLGDAAKIQNLKSYNQRLNYLLDGSGLVIKVGS